MDYIPLTDNTARQSIDSATVFSEFKRVEAAARPYAGGMYWKRQGNYEYLVKTFPDNRQQRIGARSQATEETYERFTARKKQLEERLRTLRVALTDAERLNKALRVGRVPDVVISVLAAIDDAGLTGHFTVVGTHALYAYEAAAGVRVVQGALATKDVDLLWDARKRVRFQSDLARLDTSMLGVLRKADPTFERQDDKIESAINASGFEVEFLRRETEEGDTSPFRFSDDEGDLWAVAARRAHVLTSAPKFDQVVTSTTGRMTIMRTIDPQTFIDFKQWMAEIPKRSALKRRRDASQAAIVQTLIDDGLLVSRPTVVDEDVDRSWPDAVQ